MRHRFEKKKMTYFCNERNGHTFKGIAENLNRWKIFRVFKMKLSRMLSLILLPLFICSFSVLNASSDRPCTSGNCYYDYVEKDCYDWND